MAGRLGDVVADMERRRHTYRRAAEDLRRVALCATLTDDDPRWRFSAVRRDRSDAPRLPGDTMAATASRSPAEPARRRFERQPGYRIESSLDAAGLPPTKASLIDISRGGAAFACQWAAQPGLHVIISFAGKRRRLRARVVRNNNDALAVSFLQDADPAMDAAPYGPRIEAPRSGPNPQASGKPPTASQRRPTYRLRSEGTSDFDPLSGLTTARPHSPGSAKETNQRANAGSMPNHARLRRLPHPRVRALATEQARGQVRTQRGQHFRVAAAGGGGLLAGVLLWHVLVMSLPSRTGDWLAALPLGGDPWQAGQALMHRHNPPSWDRMVRLSTACGDQSVALCERAEMAVRDAPFPASSSPGSTRVTDDHVASTATAR